MWTAGLMILGLATLSAPEDSTPDSTSAGVYAVQLNGEPGFWVPRLVFIELEKAAEARPRLEKAVQAAMARADALVVSSELWARTATAAQQGRDMCWAQVAVCQDALRQCDTRPERSCLLEGGIGAAVGAALCTGVSFAVTR